MRNQLHALTQLPVVVASVRAHLETLIETLSAQITLLEAEIGTALQADERWERAAKRLQSIPGIGLLTAAWLLAGTVKCTTCRSPEALVSYVGLAPQPYQSGASVYRRPHISHMGQRRLRTALYMAAIAAARWNPRTRPVYERLRAAGKPAKVALCAVARKLIHIAWAVVTKEQMFCAIPQCWPPNQRRKRPPFPVRWLQNTLDKRHWTLPFSGTLDAWIALEEKSIPIPQGGVMAPVRRLTDNAAGDPHRQRRLWPPH